MKTANIKIEIDVNGSLKGSLVSAAEDFSHGLAAAIWMLRSSHAEDGLPFALANREAELLADVVDTLRRAGRLPYEEAESMLDDIEMALGEPEEDGYEKKIG